MWSFRDFLARDRGLREGFFDRLLDRLAGVEKRVSPEAEGPEEEDWEPGTVYQQFKDNVVRPDAAGFYVVVHHPNIHTMAASIAVKQMRHRHLMDKTQEVMHHSMTALGIPIVGVTYKGDDVGDNTGNRVMVNIKLTSPPPGMSPQQAIQLLHSMPWSTEYSNRQTVRSRRLVLPAAQAAPPRTPPTARLAPVARPTPAPVQRPVATPAQRPTPPALPTRRQVLEPTQAQRKCPSCGRVMPDGAHCMICGT